MRELSARSNWTSVAEPLVLLSTRSLAVLSPTAWSSKTDSGSVTDPRFQRGAPLEREPGTSPGDQGKARQGKPSRAAWSPGPFLAFLTSHRIPSSSFGPARTREASRVARSINDEFSGFAEALAD